MSAIDLSLLPPPAIIEEPKFKDLKAQRLADLQTLDPEFSALLESDPAMKLLEVSVYREMVNIGRFDAGVWAVLLAYAKGADLDQLGANFDVVRLVITPADDTTIPPTPAVMESDDSYRHRIQLSWYARNTAGSIEAYRYFALSADSSVLDAVPYGPQEWTGIVSDGHVWVYVLSNTGDGTPDQTLLDTVNAALNAEFVRPLTDYVTVKAPTITNYQITATLKVGKGPDAETVKQAALDAAQRYADSVHRIGSIVSLAGIYRALKQPGVDDVVLTAPTATITPGNGSAAYCTAITLNVDQPNELITVSV
ncbi:TPA: baseplate J/gp47 family protein [Citrobacter braakii]